MQLVLLLTILPLTLCAAPRNPESFMIATTAAFFDHLRLDLPELSEVKAAVDQGDLDGAVAAYGEFWRSRPIPDHPAIRELGPRNPKYRNVYADDALVLKIHEYGTHQWTDRIQWRQPQMVTVQRFPHLPHLTAAWYHTHDERYAAAFLRDVHGYCEDWPMTQAMGFNVSPGIVGGKSTTAGNPWYWSLGPSRVERWLEALFLMRDSDALTDDERVFALSRLIEEVNWMAPETLRLNPAHNSHFASLQAWLTASQLLPEVSDAADWSTLAHTELTRSLESYFYPDGASKELTMAYTASMVKQYLEVLSTIERTPETEPLFAIATRAARWTIGLTRPDGLAPALGDLEWNVRRTGVGKLAAQVVGLDWAPHATGEDPNAPAPPFLTFPPAGEEVWGGYYAMRSGWDADARYLLVDGGPYGISHYHCDYLSFELSAYGADFIIDPGSNTYHNPDPKSVRYNLSHGFQHNLPTVDGIDQGPREKLATEPLKHGWLVTDEFELFTGSYEYPGAGVTHTRRIGFILDDAWLLEDHFSGTGYHRLELVYQLAPGTKAELLSNRIVLTAKNGARLTMDLRGPKLEARIVEGDPVFPGASNGTVDKTHSWTGWVDGGRGWVGRVRHRGGGPTPDSSVPAPCLVLSGEVDLPTVFRTVMLPAAPGQEQRVVWLDSPVEGGVEMTFTDGERRVPIRSSDVPEKPEP